MNFHKHIAMDVSGDGRYLAAINEDGDLIVWDIEGKKEHWSLAAVKKTFYSKVMFVGDDKLLVYDYGGCYCYDLATADCLWEHHTKTEMLVNSLQYGEKYSLNTISEESKTDGLVNAAEFEIDGRKTLVFAERMSGISLVDEENGSVIKQLPRETIDTLLPEDADYYKDIRLYPVEMISLLQSSDEIGYDTSHSRIMIPCYNKKTESRGGRRLVESSYPGLIMWDPASGEAEYVKLTYEFGEADARANGVEKLLYPADGMILKVLVDTDSLKLCAFDSATGKAMWYDAYDGFDTLTHIESRICRTGEGILLVGADEVIRLDPADGHEAARIKTGLESADQFELILGDAADPAALSLLTAQGRLCKINDDSVFAGEVSPVFSEDFSAYTDYLYVPAGDSYKHTGLLFMAGDARIIQYEIGLANENYEEILSGSAKDLLHLGHPKAYPAGDGYVVIKDTENAWECFALTEGKWQRQWHLAPADFEKVRKEQFTGNTLEDIFAKLTYMGTDPGRGKLLLYAQELYGFAEVDVRTGEVSLEMLPSLVTETADFSEENYDAVIKNPVIAGDKYHYISALKEGSTVSCALFSFDPVTRAYVKTDLPAGTGLNSPLGLFVDPSGKHALILGLPGGQVLVDIDTGEETIFRYDSEDETIKAMANTFYEANTSDAAGAIDPAGRYAAVNYAALNRIVIYDMKGNEVSHWDYFNTTITGMTFTGKTLTAIAYDGRLYSFRPKDMKQLRTGKLPGDHIGYAISDDRSDVIWATDNKDNAYCVDPEDLTCSQQIKNAAAVDAGAGLAVIYKNVNNDVIDIGTVPLFTEAEIIEKAKTYIGDKQLSEADEMYYGIR